MTNTNKSLLYIGAIALILAIMYLFGAESGRVNAAAPAGIAVAVATSSPNQLAAVTSTSLFATSTCSARIVTTKSSAILLTFSDTATQIPSSTFGHLQAASTTVVYDATQYGCGLVRAYSITADTVTLTETR